MKKNTNIIGCDPDVKMLQEAKMSSKKNKLPITYVLAKAEKLPFRSSQFDLITSGAAFHWFATKKAMSEIQRVLNKGGFYAVYWTQNIKTERTTIGQELYKKYKWQGIPQKLRDLEYVKDLFKKGGFTKIKTLKLPFTEKKTITETIGLIKTNSTYALLSAENKNEF